MSVLEHHHLWLITLVTIIVMAPVFFHVDLSPERREQLHLQLFAGTLVILMIIGMLWPLFNLCKRMM